MEGFNSADGKGPSIWDDFVKDKSRIADGSSGDDGPDSYLHYKDDVQLLKNTGVSFYRFSISWPRVMADGTLPSKNEAGLQYYDNLINELIANDIEPIVTMYHWDLPSRIQDLGGFTSPMFPLYFEQYAILLFQRYGDRVKQWITFNEPSQFCVKGYASSTWPPDLSVPGGEYYCIYYMQLAHARAYHTYKDQFFANQNGRVGITLFSTYSFPKDASNPADVAAASVSQQFELGVYAAPFFKGGWPDVVKEMVDKFSEEEGRTWSRLPHYDEETIAYVKGTSDFFGLNYYTSRLIEATENPSKRPFIMDDPRSVSSVDPSWPYSSDWLYSVPNGLRDLLVWITEEYDRPEIIITENGWADEDGLVVEDLDRIEYLRLHFNAILEAIDAGVNIVGHTTWSILDNFEWLWGYVEKFGIHSFDSVTKVRSPKRSVTFLKDVIETRTLPAKVPSPKFP